MTKNMGRPVANKYKVPKRAWGRWSNHAKGVFNRVFHTMRNQDLLIHPKSAPMKRKHWDTVRFNAAWHAACAADDYTLVWK
jgi:hypothetical protein